ncbi:MAG: UDP-N-acetylmuramyl-tripeptide synthetase [Candidatus Paceibacterota bacterium]|jgi:UDP-N-acetylmuramoyl-L-alanyl-D-glutamate--2,6-diaminopimelate ligase
MTAKNFIKKFTPKPLISLYHFKLSFLGALKYGFPSRKLEVIGVTGTSGKSTTVNLISNILEEAGIAVASTSSIRFRINGKDRPNLLKMTMPGRWKIQSFLREAANAGCKIAVVEVTSEGIVQHRHRFINFKMALFNNLALEHIESHGSFENYRKAKEKLFQTVKGIHILNLDDDNVEHFLKYPAEKKYGYTIKGKIVEGVQAISAKDIKSVAGGSEFEVDGMKIYLPLQGDFNVCNALAAICVGTAKGIDLSTMKKALEKTATVPGHMDEIMSEPFSIFVDYAFIPSTLEKVQQTLKAKAVARGGRLIGVLGSCGGGRDKWKRPVLGEIAKKYCDEIIITNEDPYDEDPQEIIDQVAKGAGDKAIKILDRREAISQALKLAKPEDVVILTGKGCEPWICVADGKKVAWDEKKVALEEYQKLISR